MSAWFADRRDAGRRLGERLRDLSGGWPADPIVLALPPGGVPVAVEVARELGAPMDVLVARPVGAPGQPDAVVGAIAGDAPPLFDRRALKSLGLTPRDLDAEVTRARAELGHRERLYWQHRPAPPLKGRSVVLVDDGLTIALMACAGLRLINHTA
ncbi:phosphoribosyl transferase-like protein [Streptomyces sp. TLI_235]|nr:phosphoribosyltransferase family protein [Streptomyces sp. TLI_235]PBC69968.1 phosphoribosyl transferase-like protein [Streptomyces sp. TLI_235]